MNRSINSIIILALAIGASFSLLNSAVAQNTTRSNVVAFWGFDNDYDFSDGEDGPSKQDFAADVDNTVGTANLQGFVGDPANLDDNGGGGFTSYTTNVTGTNFTFTHSPTRTLKWDDLKGGGDDFTIGGEGPSFDLDKNDGNGANADDFGNDALMYITLDGTGYRDFEVRFDVEGTPGDLPESFDIFYRTTGSSGTWFRDANQNNIPLSFMDYATVDPDNQLADSGFHSLNAALDDQSQIEIIIGDFAEFGNDEMEIDNIEIVANVVPEPASMHLFLLASLAMLGLRRKVA